MYVCVGGCRVMYNVRVAWCSEKSLRLVGRGGERENIIPRHRCVWFKSSLGNYGWPSGIKAVKRFESLECRF